MQTQSLEAILSLPPEKRIELAKAIRVKQRNKIESYYPADGHLARDKYPRHLEFFRLGDQHRERCFLAANRVGKTESVGAYETTLHLTGRYPSWWEGRRFEGPISAWAAGDTSQTTKDILQEKLLGPKHDMGIGMIPGELIQRTTPKPGVPDGIETIFVKHISGGTSDLTLKNYEQGRVSFQGTARSVIWLDEECSMDIYAECLLRTMTTNGLIICTFTPLLGLSDVVRYFMDMRPIE